MHQQFMTAFAVSLLAIIAICALPWFVGEAPEKIGSLVTMAMYAVGLAGFAAVGRGYHHADLIGVGSDLVGFLGFSAIALFARRIWPIWVSSLQLLAVTTHVARALDLHFPPLVYAVMRVSPTYAGLAIMLIGTIACWRRKQLGDNALPWLNWSARSSLPRRNA